MIKRTIHVVIPIKVEADNEECFQESAKDAMENIFINVAGVGPKGGYFYKSLEHGRKIITKPSW